MDKNKILGELLEKYYENIGLSEGIPSYFEEKQEKYNSIIDKIDYTKVDESTMILEDKYLRLELMNKPLTNGEVLPTIDVTLDSSIENANKICLWCGDITEIFVDAIVDSCDASLLGTFDFDCIDRDVHLASGIRLRKKCNDIMNGKKLLVSEYMITRAYNMPCDYILHVYAPKNGENTLEELKQTYVNILDAMKVNMIKSVALCSLSTGVGGFSMDEASQVAIDVVKEYLKENSKFFERIIFVVQNMEDFEVYKKQLLG